MAVERRRQDAGLAPDAPLEPKTDMFARMGEVALGVLEIKLLSQINGDTTPRSLVSTLGLPLYGRDWPATSDAVPGTAAGSGSSRFFFSPLAREESAP